MCQPAAHAQTLIGCKVSAHCAQVHVKTLIDRSLNVGSLSMLSVSMTDCYVPGDQPGFM